LTPTRLRGGAGLRSSVAALFDSPGSQEPSHRALGLNSAEAVLKLKQTAGEQKSKDPDGRIVYHHRTVDTLGKMLRAGTITQEMHDAAKDFQAAFILAIP
jgi:hypothetical protein